MSVLRGTSHGNYGSVKLRNPKDSGEKVLLVGFVLDITYTSSVEADTPSFRVDLNVTDCGSLSAYPSMVYEDVVFPDNEQYLVDISLDPPVVVGEEVEVMFNVVNRSPQTLFGSLECFYALRLLHVPDAPPKEPIEDLVRRLISEELDSRVPMFSGLTTTTNVTSQG